MARSRIRSKTTEMRLIFSENSTLRYVFCLISFFTEQKKNEENVFFLIAVEITLKESEISRKWWLNGSEKKLWLKFQKCGYQLFGRCVKCLLPRAEIGEYWPRLTKEKQRIHWLKVDFVRWRVSEAFDQNCSWFEKTKRKRTRSSWTSELLKLEKSQE